MRKAEPLYTGASSRLSVRVPRPGAGRKRLRGRQLPAEACGQGTDTGLGLTPMNVRAQTEGEGWTRDNGEKANPQREHCGH